jgi:hypothetical protein
MAGGFAQPDVARDDGFENLVLKMAPDFLRHLVGEVVTAVEHGEENAFDLQLRIESLLDEPDRFEAWPEPSIA